MVVRQILLREIFRLWRPNAAASGCGGTLTATNCERQHYCTTATAVDDDNSNSEKNKNKWLILPPFTTLANGYEIGRPSIAKEGGATASPPTALKWILKCCPDIPRCLVQKLFRLRQVRKEHSFSETKEYRLKRVGAKDLMNIGDRIFLPKSVDEKCPSTTPDNQSLFNEEELKFVQSLELYKDPAIIVIDKPPGMPVQGGLGITRSLDELAAKYLRYDYKELPRLVHRLDRDSSGILVMGRTQLTATVLHSIFRENTFGAPNDVVDGQRTLQKKYCALVIGSPRRREGLISVPLGKVVVDNGKSERVTVIDHPHELSSQHAVTEYRVIKSISSGYTWLELSPLTGRKHQLRVHCAEVLGTPIVGDYKYGWQAHKKLNNLLTSASECKQDENSKLKQVSFCHQLEKGSLSDKLFRLHLHCKEMVLPNIHMALQHDNVNPDQDNNARVERIKVNAPLPAHMQRSWDLLNLIDDASLPVCR